MVKFLVDSGAEPSVKARKRVRKTWLKTDGPETLTPIEFVAHTQRLGKLNEVLGTPYCIRIVDRFC